VLDALYLAIGSPQVQQKEVGDRALPPARATRTVQRVTTMLVDGHVHLHTCFGVEAFLEAALSNFEAARRELGEPDAIACLLFSESSWSHYFVAFTRGLLERTVPGWRVDSTSEDCSIVACKNGAAPLVFISGRQIVTAERLEVLALGTVREYPDGLPFREALDLAVASGAIPVVPWGFGKWTGARGRAVEEALRSSRAGEIFLGDNGGRPAVAPTPRLFEVARATGVPILPGSDPLPLPGEVGKPGRVGFVLEGPVDTQRPSASIRALLSARSQPRRFGRNERLTTFVVRQAALRLRRRRAERSADAPVVSSPTEF